MKFFSRHGIFLLLEIKCFFSTRLCDDAAGLSLFRDWKKTIPRRGRIRERRFGTLKEKKLFYGKEFSHDTILAQDVRLTLLDKKPPQYDRNKNIAVIGGSGSGKTFRFVKPNLIQMNSSNIVVDPKDHLAEKTGKLFLEHGYQVKVLDLVNMKNSDALILFAI